MYSLQVLRTCLLLWLDNPSITLGEWEEIPGGYLSRAFKIPYKSPEKEGELFLRTCKTNSSPYNYAFDRLGSFMISHEMYRRWKSPVQSYGVFGIRKDWTLAKDLLENDLEYFHVQDFRAGNSIDKKLAEIGATGVLTDDSKDLLRTIANTLAEVHNQPVESGISTANAVKRSQREIFINPQTTIDTLANFPKDHPLFGALTGKYAYLEKMLRTIDYWADFADSIPCVPLHGDFWSANILEESNGAIFLIDYSRIPFGDPSIDVGTFLGAHLIFDGIIKKSRVHFEAARYFVEQYLLKRNTPDATLIQRIPMVLFWIAIIRIYPPVYGNLPEKHMHEFAAYIDMCYRNRDDILNYDLCASALFDMEKPRMQM